MGQGLWRCLRLRCRPRTCSGQAPCVVRLVFCSFPLTTVACARSGSKSRLRFCWWAAEEEGLLGSIAYFDQLAPADRRAIVAYLNQDMLGSLNAINNIFDGSTAPPAIRNQSLGLTRLYEREFRALSLPYELQSFSSDINGASSGERAGSFVLFAAPAHFCATAMWQTGAHSCSAACRRAAPTRARARSSRWRSARSSADTPTRPRTHATTSHATRSSTWTVRARSFVFFCVALKRLRAVTTLTNHAKCTGNVLGQLTAQANVADYLMAMSRASPLIATSAKLARAREVKLEL